MLNDFLILFFNFVDKLSYFDVFCCVVLYGAIVLFFLDLCTNFKTSSFSNYIYCLIALCWFFAVMIYSEYKKISVFDIRHNYSAMSLITCSLCFLMISYLRDLNLKLAIVKSKTKRFYNKTNKTNINEQTGNNDILYNNISSNYPINDFYKNGIVEKELTKNEENKNIEKNDEDKTEILEEDKNNNIGVFENYEYYYDKVDNNEQYDNNFKQMYVKDENKNEDIAKNIDVDIKDKIEYEFDKIDSKTNNSIKELIEKYENNKQIEDETKKKIDDLFEKYTSNNTKEKINCDINKNSNILENIFIDKKDAVLKRNDNGNVVLEKTINVECLEQNILEKVKVLLEQNNATIDERLGVMKADIGNLKDGVQSMVDKLAQLFDLFAVAIQKVNNNC